MWVAIIFLFIMSALAFTLGWLIGLIKGKEENQGRPFFWRDLRGRTDFRPVCRYTLPYDGPVLMVVLTQEKDGGEDYLLVKFDRWVVEKIPPGCHSTFWVEGKHGEEKVNSYNWPGIELE